MKRCTPVEYGVRKSLAMKPDRALGAQRVVYVARSAMRIAEGIFVEVAL